MFPQYAAAKYYRLAEKNGNKTLGNSWYVALEKSFLLLLCLFSSDWSPVVRVWTVLCRGYFSLCTAHGTFSFVPDSHTRTHAHMLSLLEPNPDMFLYVT